MYRHLLVPVEESQLSVRTVGRAVEFARSIGARITFLHARSGYGASSIAALERVLAPADLDDRVAGEARGIVAKAESAAQAAGVPCEGVVVSSDRPFEAILDTARARGCDLIFMASHGRRGMRALVLGSQTQKVLQNTTIPVLVSAVAGNAPEPAICGPLAVIIDEHRSIAAVIRGMERVVSVVRENGEPPPFALLRAMLHYIKAFPEALHHPKENTYLFVRLRARTSEFDETLAELERQHAEGHAVVARLEQALGDYEANPAGGLPAFTAAVEQFAATQWSHMNLENSVILPAAQKHLSDEDWREIGEAFAANGDPRFAVDGDDDYRRLFARILELAPR